MHRCFRVNAAVNEYEVNPEGMTAPSIELL